MTPEEIAAITRLVMSQQREIAKLRAFQNTFYRLCAELVRRRAVSLEAAELLARFHDWQDEEQGAALAELESQFPSLAAELDRGRHEPGS